MRRLAVVAAVALGLVLALAAMPGCGLGCPTPEQTAYLKKVEEWAKRTESGYGDLEAILGEVETRPEALIDEGWRRRLRGALDELDVASRQMIVREPPVGTEEVHGLVVRVAEATIEANELFWEGVLNVDAETMTRSLNKRDETIPLAEEVIRVMERFCE